MFFITAIDFWIHRFEEHMQKVILENFGVPHTASMSKIKVSTEWLILNLFKIENSDLPIKEWKAKITPHLLTELTDEPLEKINPKSDLSSYVSRYPDQQIRFNLLWQDLINQDHDFLLKKITEFFNPNSTTFNLTQFKLLLVFRLQQKCLQFREEAYLRLEQRDTLKKEIKQIKATIEDLKKQVEQQKQEQENKQKIEQKKPEELKEIPTKIALEQQIELLAKYVEELNLCSRICSDEILLKQILEAIENTKILMQKLEEKAAFKINQVTVTPSDGRTGELLHDFSQTLAEIFQFFKEIDQSSELTPNQKHAFLDCSPKKVFKKNDPLLIIYENVLPYLLSNYSRSAIFDRLKEENSSTSLLTNLASSFINLAINPSKTISDKITLLTYDSKMAEDKRNVLIKIILSLRTSVRGQSLKTPEKKINQGLWDNCERTLLLESEQAAKNQGYSYSPWPQQLTLFFEQTKQNIKACRESLNQQNLVSAGKSVKIAK